MVASNFNSADLSCLTPQSPSTSNPLAPVAAETDTPSSRALALEIAKLNDRWRLVKMLILGLILAPLALLTLAKATADPEELL